MKKQAYIFVLLFIVSMVTVGQFQDETFGHLNEKNGLSSGVVTCILKDSHGFMWFGTQAGLNKYDAHSFNTYHKNDSVHGAICGNFIHDLCEDEQGNIWVGTENNGVCKYIREKNEFKKYIITTPSIGSAPIRVKTILKNVTNELLIGTENGLFIFSKGSDSFIKWAPLGIEHPLFTASINELYEDNDSTMWIGTDQGLFHFSASTNTFRQFQFDASDPNTLSNNTINCIFRASNDSLYIGTNEGLNSTDGKSGSFNRYYYNPNNIFSSEKSEIQAIVEDGRGNLWIGSFGGGLIKAHTLSKNKLAIYTHDPNDPGSMTNDYVYSMFYDEAGIVWIGTYGGGINKIDQVRIRFDMLEHDPKDENSMAGSEVYAVITIQDEVWIGTENGISIYYSESQLFTHIQNEKGFPGRIPGDAIYCFLEDHHENIWVGTAANGLFKLDKKNRETRNYAFTRFSIEAEEGYQISANEILSLYEDENHTVWVGTSNGIDLIKNDFVVRSFKNDPTDSTSLSNNEVYIIFQDSDATIWVGNNLGLNKFNHVDSSFIHFNAMQYLNKPLNPNTVYSIYQGNAGDIWIGTDNAGLIKFNPVTEKVKIVFTKENGLPDNVIYGILEDDENNLWLSSNNGLIKAIQHGTSENLTFIRYNSSNGLKTDAFNIGAFEKSADGKLYFGSNEGLTFFHPENVKGNNYVPPVFITDFQLFFKPVLVSTDGSTPLSADISMTKKIELRHDQNVLKFGFTALNYIQSEKNKFAFRMEGLENDWNYVDNQREAQYLYIPPGEYTFRVKASNSDGVWNETGVSLDLIIKPPFTSTVWFYLILIFGLGLITYWILQIRTRRLRETRDLLEKQIQKRTGELRKTNQNLEEEIRERKNVEEALKKSEARFRQLIETMNEGFSVQDKEGKINYVNPKLCEMFGFAKDEIIGKFPEDFVDDTFPVYLERFKQYRVQGIKTGVIGSYEMNWKRKNGSVFIAMVSPKPIFDNEGIHTGSVAVLTDITDLKIVENELLTKNEALNEALENLKITQAQLIDSEKMASLGQLTAGVAHEINNPINFVSGNVKPLRRDINDVLEVLFTYDKIVEEAKLSHKFESVRNLKEEIDFEFVLSEINNLLDGIGEGAVRTAEIVKGLRNFSRMDEHELKPANINQGLNSTLLILHNKLKERIEVVKDFADFPDILCYPGQLNQVFLNLLNNAQESIEGKGKIYIKTYVENNDVKVSIKDTGKGIPPTSINRIFEPFYTTKEVGKGTGLGLSISYGIIEKHRGKIEVKSEPGKGSEFIITLPGIENNQ